MARQLANGLAARGYEVTTIAGRTVSPLSKSDAAIEQLRVPCLTFTKPPARWLRFIRADLPLLAQCRTFLAFCRANAGVFQRILDCDVTVTFLEPETVAVSRWRGTRGLPNISYFPGAIRSSRLRRDLSVVRLAASHALAAHYHRRPEIPIHGVLYPGIEFDPTAMPRQIRERAVRAVFVGRLEANKGIGMLLEIARECAAHQVEIELRLIGDGPMRKVVAREAARLKAPARIVSLGSMTSSEVQRELAAADLFIFPSQYESFGIVVLEALAAGLPIVCSDLPALREVAGEAALFVPVNSTAAWIATTRRLLEDADARRRLSDHAQKRARRFDLQATIDTLEGHIKEALDHSAAART